MHDERSLFWIGTYWRGLQHVVETLSGRDNASLGNMVYDKTLVLENIGVLVAQRKGTLREIPSAQKVGIALEDDFIVTTSLFLLPSCRSRYVLKFVCIVPCDP